MNTAALLSNALDEEREKVKALLVALEHIRKIVSPMIVGQEECDRLDAAIRAAKGESA